MFRRSQFRFQLNRRYSKWSFLLKINMLLFVSVLVKGKREDDYLFCVIHLFVVLVNHPRMLINSLRLISKVKKWRIIMMVELSIILFLNLTFCFFFFFSSFTSLGCFLCDPTWKRCWYSFNLSWKYEFLIKKS